MCNVSPTVIRDCVDVLGIGRSRMELRNMVKALGFHAWLNTAEDRQRKLAAEIALSHWREFQAECDARRNRKFNARR